LFSSKVIFSIYNRFIINKSVSRSIDSRKKDYEEIFVFLKEDYLKNPKTFSTRFLAEKNISMNNKKIMSFGKIEFRSYQLEKLKEEDKNSFLYNLITSKGQVVLSSSYEDKSLINEPLTDIGFSFKEPNGSIKFFITTILTSDLLSYSDFSKDVRVYKNNARKQSEYNLYIPCLGVNLEYEEEFSQRLILWFCVVLSHLLATTLFLFGRWLKE
jgi:hypothetical protein